MEVTKFIKDHSFKNRKYWKLILSIVCHGFHYKKKVTMNIIVLYKTVYFLRKIFIVMVSNPSFIVNYRKCIYVTIESIETYGSEGNIVHMV